MSSHNFKYPISTRTIFFGSIILCCSCAAAYASGATLPDMSIGNVLLALVVILVAAKLGGDIFVRLGQPAVLGELVFGIVIGNVSIFGFHGFDFIRRDESIRILSEIGVMLLLFQVGLESDMRKMMKVGASSLLVATLGVVAPFFLGWAASALLLPSAGLYTHIFIGATLCATSVGISARVLRDMGQLQTPEARIILGAAVIDDVQGLIILAVVQGIITASASGSPASTWTFFAVALKAVVFLIGALLIGQRLSPRIFGLASRMKAGDLLLTCALAFCFVFAYAARLIGLAPIVGAFAAGLILDEVHWKDFSERGEHGVEELIQPLAAFLVPIFFVYMGAGVVISNFADPKVLLFAAILTAAAIIGKQVCGLGAMGKDINRLVIGIGMIPRGEVGLIFAAIGSGLRVEGKPVVEPATFSAIVIMVVLTTMMTPPLLKWSMRNKRTAD